jgi:hypothetical protein
MMNNSENNSSTTSLASSNSRVSDGYDWGQDQETDVNMAAQEIRAFSEMCAEAMICQYASSVASSASSGGVGLTQVLGAAIGQMVGQGMSAAATGMNQSTFDEIRKSARKISNAYEDNALSFISGILYAQQNRQFDPTDMLDERNAQALQTVDRFIQNSIQDDGTSISRENLWTSLQNKADQIIRSGIPGGLINLDNVGVVRVNAEVKNQIASSPECRDFLTASWHGEVISQVRERELTGQFEQRLSGRNNSQNQGNYR